MPVGTHAGSSSHQVTQGRRWPQGAAVIVNESVGYTLVDKVGVAGEIAEER